MNSFFNELPRGVQLIIRALVFKIFLDILFFALKHFFYKIGFYFFFETKINFLSKNVFS